MNQNILIHNSEACGAEGQMQVPGKGFLAAPFHGRRTKESG